MNEKKQTYQETESKFLLDSLTNFKKELSKKKLKSFLKHKMIYVNEKPITNPNYLLQKNDTVTIYYNNKQITNYNLEILYEDKDLIAINKPHGLLSISNAKEKDLTAFKLVRDYLKKKNPHLYLFTVHRLDQETSGVLLFAKNQKIKEALQSDWNNLVKKRGYYALIENQLTPSQGTFSSYLIESKASGLIYSTKNPNLGKLAITNYQTIAQTDNYSLLDIDIKTGRRNQIRVHLSENNHPILGDKKYHSKHNPLKRLALHAYELTLIDPRTNLPLTIKTNLPQEFKDLIKLKNSQ